MQAGLRILNIPTTRMFTTEKRMPAYVIGLLTDVDFNAEIIEYIRTIESTMKPYDGRFIVHGAHAEVLEGTMNQDCIIAAFPSIDHARRWYASDAYGKLIPLRTRNSKGAIFLIDGVSDHYSASMFIDKMTGANPVQDRVA